MYRKKQHMVKSITKSICAKNVLVAVDSMKQHNFLAVLHLSHLGEISRQMLSHQIVRKSKEKKHTLLLRKNLPNYSYLLPTAGPKTGMGKTGPLQWVRFAFV